MSFSLNSMPRAKEIKAKQGAIKRDLVANCYVIIKKQDKITSTVRVALEHYLSERLRAKSVVNLSCETLQDNIKELLEFCCNKEYDDITEKDVINHEKKILQQLLWCTRNHNTKRLIFNEEEYEMYGLNSKDLGKVNVFDDTDKDMETYLAYLERLGNNNNDE